MKNTNNSKRNYRINFTTMTLTMTVDFAERAYNPATDEYKILLRLQHDFPDLKVERKTHRTPKKYITQQGEVYTHNQFKGLTYERMERFFSRIPNGKAYQEEYEVVKDFAEVVKDNAYVLVRKWFVEQFPEFRKNPMFYFEYAPNVITGVDFMKRESTASEEKTEQDVV